VIESLFGFFIEKLEQSITCKDNENSYLGYHSSLGALKRMMMKVVRLSNVQQQQIPMQQQMPIQEPQELLVLRRPSTRLAASTNAKSVTEAS
jgi:hypothetical protein